ncbi:2-oxoacid:acceptor oxidoreductase family protein [Candidatus Binatia bacterium]|nr:2-oxoacid:acceptor oxidoreductase family protein [Candidatus Binatia bacterium]
MLWHIRFHGRGGEGVKLACRIVTRAGFIAGMTVQDSPLYGAERRGAPVVAFARIADEPILERGYIECPDAVVVMDASLLRHADAGVLSGIDAQTVVLVNSPGQPQEVARSFGIVGHVVTLDVSSLALDVLGKHVLSAPVAGFVARVCRLVPRETLATAVRTELVAAGIPPAAVARNLALAERAFAAAPSVGLPVRRENRCASSTAAESPFVVPHLPPRVAAPTIGAPATSALRTLEGWRVYRPVIERNRCTRCLICFALCPEGAIALDGQNYPVVDYAHCKGCLVCATECPPGAIDQVREDAA